MQDFVDNMKASGGENWPNDSVYESGRTLSSAFASIADMQKEMVTKAQREKAEKVSWLSALHARRNKAQTALDKAVWSLVISDAEQDMENIPWQPGSLEALFSAYRDDIAYTGTMPGEAADAPPPQAEETPVPPQATAAETPVQAQPVPEPDFEAPMSIEIDGLQYHALLDSDVENPTPPGVVHLMVIRHGFVYVCSRPTQVPRRTTKTVATTIKGQPLDVIVAGTDWTPIPGTKAEATARPVPPPPMPKGNAQDKGKAKAEPSSAQSTYEAMGGEPASAPSKKRTSSKGLPTAFPGRSASTQMASCSCDTYPCVHTKSNIRAWHTRAKLPTQPRPKSVPKGQNWETDPVGWPKDFESAKPADPLTKENPAKVENLPKPFHGDRVPPELLKAARTHLKLTDDPFPSDYAALPKEQQKVERAKRVTPRWVSAALSADPANLAKIVKGEITKDSHIQGKPRAPGPSTGTPKGEPKQAPLTAGQRWASLKSRFKDVSLWQNPATPREKQFKAAFDTLASSLTAKEREALPKLRKRPRNLSARDTTATATTSAHSPLSGLNDLLTMAKLLGEVVKALNPK
jgi:hypothetical protein